MVRTGSRRQLEARESLQSREARSAGLTQDCRRQEWTQGNVPKSWESEGSLAQRLASETGGRYRGQELECRDVGAGVKEAKQVSGGARIVQGEGSQGKQAGRREGICVGTW